MKYILIIMVWYYHYSTYSAITTAEFNNKEACTTASDLAREASPARVLAFCTPKGEE